MKTFLAFLLPILFSTLLQAQNTLDNAGLTSATPSSVAFSLRKLSTAYSGPAIKVRRLSDNAEATVAFDGSGNTTAASNVTFMPGVTIGATTGTTQAGTITSGVSRTGTITIKANKTGTLSCSNSSLTVTGSGTSFTTEVVVGDRLFNGTNNLFLGVVASISSNTSLQLANTAAVSSSAISFKTTNASVTGTGTNFSVELAIGDRLFTTTNTYLGTVSGITNATTLTLNAVDAVSVTAASYKGSSATINGIGTNFTSLAVGDLLISNNITVGIISSITNATTLTLTTKAGACISGLGYKTTTGTIAFSTFYAGTSVFLNTWYDQSGNGRDATQLKTANQARIVNAGVLSIVNGRTSMEFSNLLSAFVQTSSVANYLNNTVYTLNKVTAEATINPNLQFPVSTTGGNGPSNTIAHYGYRSSSQFTVAQYGNDHNFNATPSTSLEIHTSVKSSTSTSQFFKNGISLGSISSGAPSHLNNVGLLNIGFYSPTSSYYNGSISEVIVFASALNNTNLTLLNDNQLAYYTIASTFWTGAVSTDWTNTGNWSTGVVPTISSPSIVVIPAGKPRYPIISGTSPANSISLEAGTSLTITGTLQIAGTINNLGTCTATAGTIQYTGTAPQTIGANTFAGNVIQNVVVNNSTGVMMGGNLTISGNLGFTTGYLSVGNTTLTLGGTVTNTIAGGLRGSATSNITINGLVSPTLSFDQTTPGTTNVLRNLTINSSGQVVTLANNLVLNSTGTTTFTAGKLAIAGTTLTIKGGIVNTVNEGLRGSTSANLIIDGTASATLSFDQTTPGTTNALNNLTLNCSGQTATLNRNIVIASTLTITSGTLADGGNVVSSTGTISIGAGTFKLGSATVATVWPSFATNTISTSGTVEYASGVAQIVSAVPVYHHLTISAAGGTTAANDLTVNGILNLSAANPSSTVGSLAMSSYTLNMGATATTVGQGDVTGVVKRTTVLPNTTYTMGNEFTYITFPSTGILPSQMSMRIAIGVAPTWQPGAINRTYDFIQTGGSGTKAVINAHYLDAELNGNIENRLVDYSYRYTGAVVTEHGKSNFNTTQNWVALSNVNVAFFGAVFGTTQLSLEESALTTLTWNGSTSTSWITATNWTPNGGPSTNTILIIPDASTTPNDPYLPATASNGSLTIESGGIVNSDPGAQLTINNSGLAWSNNGTFNANTSNIIFTNPNATINGTTNFYDVTINTGAALLPTTGSVMRITGTITNNGTWNPGLLNNTVEYNGNNQTIISPNGSTQAYYNLIISGTGTSVLPATPLNVVSDLTINGVISTTGNTIGMTGTGAQTINAGSPLTLNNLSINNPSGTVSLNQNLTVANQLTITAGKLAIGNNTLALSGNVTNTVPYGVRGGLSSNLLVNGTASPTLSFDQSTPGVTNALNDFTINSSGQVPSLGSDLDVNGTMIFTAGKLALNGNTLHLKGAITNSVSGGLRGSAGSNLIVSGGLISPTLSFDQTTIGTTNLLNNFSVNSTAQAVTLANPLQVAGSLDLTDGLITTTGANSLSLLSSAVFTGGSDAAYIDGPLIRYTTTTNAFTFPVGKNNTFRPVTITPTTAMAGVYSAEYEPMTSPAGTYSPGMSGIATNEYWNISKLSGPDAAVTLLYTDINAWSNGSPTSMDYIFVAQYTAGNWDPRYGSTVPGNTVGGVSPVISTTLSSFSTFTFGLGVNPTLPVTLLEFKATGNGSFNDLLWKTVDEDAFAKFEIQRSADGRQYYTIGSVTAATRGAIKTYNWQDNGPLAGSNFYRLKMIDKNGAFKFSKVVKVSRGIQKSLTVYPNPIISRQVGVEMIGQRKGDYHVNIYAVSGEKILSSIISHNGVDGVTNIVLQKSLTSGLYYFEVIDPLLHKTVSKMMIQ